MKYVALKDVEKELKDAGACKETVRVMMENLEKVAIQVDN